MWSERCDGVMKRVVFHSLSSGLVWKRENDSPVQMSHQGEPLVFLCGGGRNNPRIWAKSLPLVQYLKIFVKKHRSSKDQSIIIASLHANCGPILGEFPERKILKPSSTLSNHQYFHITCRVGARWSTERFSSGAPRPLWGGSLVMEDLFGQLNWWRRAER